MPQLIEHIDAIARRKERAVLYLEFHPREEWRRYRFEADNVREGVLAWLDANQVPWQPCGPFAVPGGAGPYLGQVYLDVPFDVDLPAYERLRDYLECADGIMRHPGVRFYVMPYDHAQQNAAHDAPLRSNVPVKRRVVQAPMARRSSSTDLSRPRPVMTTISASE